MDLASASGGLFNPAYWPVKIVFGESSPILINEVLVGFLGSLKTFWRMQHLGVCMFLICEVSTCCGGRSDMAGARSACIQVH